MKRRLAVVVSLAAAALATAPVGADDSPLVGFGSSYPAPLIARLAVDLHTSGGALVDYTAVGSKDGRKEFIAGHGDFALSDQPFHPSEAAQLAAAGRTYSYAPVAAGPLVFAINLWKTEHERITDLKLSPVTLAKIFTGEISSWTDEAIAADNGVSRLTVSQSTMNVYVRSDSNGTTWALSSWIKAVAPETWKNFTAHFNLPDEPVERWPSVNTGTSAGSAELLAQRVAHAADKQPQAITYLPPSYATSFELPAVAVKNHAGSYVVPTVASAAKGLAGAAVDGSTHVLSPNYDVADAEAYPLNLVTYAIAPMSTTTPESQGRLAAFLQLAMDHPEVASELGYPELPKPLADGTRAVIADLKAAAAAAASTTSTTTPPTTAGTAGSSSTTATSTSPTTATTAVPTPSTTLAPAGPPGGSPRAGSQVVGDALAFTGATAWRWKLPVGLLLAALGEALRWRQRLPVPVGNRADRGRSPTLHEPRKSGG